MRFIILFIGLALGLPSIFGQDGSGDSITYVSGKHLVSGEKITVDTSLMWLPNPKKATMLSAAIPGAGQIYNKDWWKVPFIYAGLGTIGYFIYWNNRSYVRYTNAYLDYVDDDPTTTRYTKILPEGFDVSDSEWLETILESRRISYRRDRDLLIISMVGFYVLNVLEANVAANLYDFDVSDDLSMNMTPSLGYNSLNGNPTLGFSLIININK